MSHYDEQREKEVKTDKCKDVKTAKRPYGYNAKSAFWV